MTAVTVTLSIDVRKIHSQSGRGKPAQHTHTRKHKDSGDSFVNICNNDLLYLADHCYNVIGDEKLKSICDNEYCWLQQSFIKDNNI